MGSESDDIIGSLKTLKAYYGKQLYGITRTREFEIPSASKQILPIAEDEILIVEGNEFHLYKQGQKNQTIQTGNTKVGYVQYDEKSDSIYWIAREDRTLRKMNKTTGEAEIVERLHQSVESFVLTKDDKRIYRLEYQPWYKLRAGTQILVHNSETVDFKSRTKLTCFCCNEGGNQTLHPQIVVGVKRLFPSLVRNNASFWRPSLNKCGYLEIRDQSEGFSLHHKIEQLDNGNGRIRSFCPSSVCVTKKSHILVCDTVNNEIHVLAFSEDHKKYRFQKGIKIEEEFGNTADCENSENLTLIDISIYSDTLFVRLNHKDDKNIPIKDTVVCCKLITSNLSS